MKRNMSGNCYLFLTKELKFFKIISIITICIFFTGLYSFASDDSVIFLTSVDIQTIDPGSSSDIYSGKVLNNIFEGLVIAGRDSRKVEPGLAVKWKISGNGRIWDFFLRKGVKFHNGKDFTSRDVEYTFKSRLENENKYKYWNLLFSNIISDIIPLNNYTIRFVLKKPYVPFLFQLATTSALIISNSSQNKNGFIPMGTGPFKFDKWVKEKYVSIIRYGKYWGKTAKVRKVVFKVVPDSAWRLLQIKTLKGDMTFITSGKEYNEVSGRRNLKIASFPSTSIHYLGFNVGKEPFDKVFVRRAFAHLLNKKLLIKHLFQNFAKNATTPIPGHIFGFDGKIKDYKFDINRAKDLLIKAGYPEGFKTSIVYSSSSPYLDEIVGVIVRAAKKIKVKVVKVPMQFSKLREYIDSGKHGLFILGWRGNIPDPDNFLFPVFSNNKGNLNRSNYNNPLVSNLLDRGRIETDRNVRIVIYRKIQEIIHRDVP